MKLNRKIIVALVLLLVCIIIHLYSNNTLRVERGYSSHFFVSFSEFLRYMFGAFPISMGDILYGFFVCWLLWSIIDFFRKKKSGTFKTRLFTGTLKIFTFCCGLYIIFNIFWGMNYDRKGIAWQLGLKMEKYSKTDLEEMNCLLIDKINASKKILMAEKIKYPSNQLLFKKVAAAYKNISIEYPFLNYQPSSIKSSMWGWLGNYTGFTGYYNPFTGEAQLNTTVPGFLQPFIACHEAAHQLGYAKEMEANFVGYLAASAFPDTLFHYSVYLDLFTYANRNLYSIDSTAAKLYRHELDTAVIEDYREWFAFNNKYRNPAEPVIRWIYGKYLENNSQPQGLLSYDEVTAFIISYYKKYGKI